MKLKDLLSEGRFDMEHPNPEDEEEREEHEDDDSCPSCGRQPGEGYGDTCDDPGGCGYWKDWAREAAAEWKRDQRHEEGLGEGADFFDRYMKETLEIEDLKARQLKAPVVTESYGKIRQKRVQELPWNRIRMVRK